MVCLLQAEPALDVWLQLLERCAAEPGCHPTALRSLAQQLAEQRALTAQQQQQVAGLQEQLSAQQLTAAEQIAGLQQQVAGLQEQVSAQQQAAAQQGAQIAALHAQMQELLQRQQH